eukprot:4926076-Prymnesium_polylepis.1
MSGWDNLEGKNKRTGVRLVENAKLRHPGHLGLDHVRFILCRTPRRTAATANSNTPTHRASPRAAAPDDLPLAPAH